MILRPIIQMKFWSLQSLTSIHCQHKYDTKPLINSSQILVRTKQRKKSLHQKGTTATTCLSLGLSKTLFVLTCVDTCAWLQVIACSWVCNSKCKFTFVFSVFVSVQRNVVISVNSVLDRYTGFWVFLSWFECVDKQNFFLDVPFNMNVAIYVILNVKHNQLRMTVCISLRDVSSVRAVYARYLCFYA